jgi:hypothetical protein
LPKFVFRIQKKDKKRGVKFLENAVELSFTNFQAWMDLTSTLMSELQDEKNSSRCKEIFSKLLQPDVTWENNKQKGGVLFQHGLFCLLTGETEAAIEAWLERARVDPPENYPSFHDIPSIFKRYSFNKEIHLTPVLQIIVKTVKQKLEISPETKELENLMKKLSDVVKSRTGQPQRQHRSSFNDSDDFQFQGQRRRAPVEPSAADSDNSWRTSAPPAPAVSMSVSVSPPGNQNQYYSRYGNVSSQQPWNNHGNRGRNNFSRNRNSYSGGSGDGHGHDAWKGHRRHERERRSPSPDSWR